MASAPPESQPRLPRAPDKEGDDIRKLEHRGTAPVTAFATVSDALDLNQTIGLERFAARYRYLKRRWADRFANRDRVVSPSVTSPSTEEYLLGRNRRPICGDGSDAVFRCDVFSAVR